MTTWQVQSAKQRFSEVLRAVATGEPQFITKHGEPVAVMIDIAAYRRSNVAKATLNDYLLAAASDVGLADDLELPERTIESDRAAQLFEQA